MARYHNPKTGKTVEAKNMSEAVELMIKEPKKEKPKVNKDALKEALKKVKKDDSE